jgi:hypothetical protein
MILLNIRPPELADFYPIPNDGEKWEGEAPAEPILPM